MNSELKLEVLAIGLILIPAILWIFSSFSEYIVNNSKKHVYSLPTFCTSIFIIFFLPIGKNIYSDILGVVGFIMFFITFMVAAAHLHQFNKS